MSQLEDQQAFPRNFPNYFNIPREEKSDPSPLTTEQLLREIANLKEVLEARFAAMDKASGLTLEIADRIPEDTRIKIQALRTLHEEKFNSFAIQLIERDVRTKQASDANALQTRQASEASAQALAAALQAAKELVGAQGEASAAAAVKSETSFTKQIDQIGVIVESKDKATDARITELKERIDRNEGNSQGATANKTSMYALAGFLLTAMLIINILGASGILSGGK